VQRALSSWVKRLGCEADDAPLTSAEVKETWVYSPIPPYIFMPSAKLVKYRDNITLLLWTGLSFFTLPTKWKKVAKCEENMVYKDQRSYCLKYYSWAAPLSLGTKILNGSILFTITGDGTESHFIEYEFCDVVLRFYHFLQGNKGVRRLAGSECVLFSHLRLTVEWGTVRARPDTLYR
jgi:hypothetical protein